MPGKAIDPLREAVKVLRFPVGNRSPADAIIDWVRGSPDVRVVNEISAYAQIDVEKLLPALGFSARTLARKREKGQPLDPNQADRAARLARIIGLAESILGSKEAAGRWLQKENRVLGRAPLSLLDTDVGAERVEEILMRLEYGVYS